VAFVIVSPEAGGVYTLQVEPAEAHGARLDVHVAKPELVFVTATPAPPDTPAPDNVRRLRPDDAAQETPPERL
jgi:hypothetical protein